MVEVAIPDGTETATSGRIGNMEERQKFEIWYPKAIWEARRRIQTTITKSIKFERMILMLRIYDRLTNHDS
jgi:hypothetical protein